MVGRFLPAALAAMTVYGMAGTPVSAATVISQTVAIPATIATQTAPGGTALVNFNQFDPTLGTLLGVSLSFQATSNTTVTITNNTAQTRNWSVTPGGTASLSGNGFTLSDSYTDPTSQLSIGPRFGPGDPRTITFSSSGSYSAGDSLVSGLAPFIGAGAVQFTFAALNQWIASGSGGSAIFNPDSYGGIAKIEYRYELPSGIVPEPATWALLIAGFAMVGSSARRRRSITLS
jgi:hypothetical protein